MLNVRDQIINYAQISGEFQTNALLQNILEEVKTSKQNVLWHLYRLVDQGQLLRVGRGRYTIDVKQRFTPHPNAKVHQIYQLLKKQFPLLSFCVYSGEILADLQHHLSYNNNIYIETERDATEVVFHFLQDCKERVFLSPNADFVADYIHLDQESLIVKPLISEAPVQEVEGVPSPRLEKLLVDTLCDKDFFYLHGQETTYMLKKAMESYAIKTDQLLRYASRRNIKPKLEQLIAE